MRERLSDYQEMYDNELYNLEATPAESTAFRLAKHDRKRYPDIITAGGKNGDAPYYTNSSHLPVSFSEDIFAALDIQDELQTLYTSGTVFHAFLGEKLPGWESAAKLVEDHCGQLQAALLYPVPHILRMPHPRLPCGRALHLPPLRQGRRGIQPHNRLLPPRPELERRQEPGIPGAPRIRRGTSFHLARCQGKGRGESGSMLRHAEALHHQDLPQLRHGKRAAQFHRACI